MLVLLCVNEGLLNKEKKEQMLLVQYTVRWLGVTLEQEWKGKVVDPRSCSYIRCWMFYCSPRK